MTIEDIYYNDELKLPEYIKENFWNKSDNILKLSDLKFDDIKNNLALTFDNDKLLFSYANLIDLWFIKFENKNWDIYIDLIANINANDDDVSKFELELEHCFLNHTKLWLDKIDWLGKYMLEIFISIIKYNWFDNISLDVVNPNMLKLFESIKNRNILKDYKFNETLELDLWVLADNYKLYL